MNDKPLELKQSIIDPSFSEDPSDEERDMEIVKEMLDRSLEAHMAVEVIHDFTKNIRAGKSIEEAAREALYEWDC